jgi:hypothetical protein
VNQRRVTLMNLSRPASLLAIVVAAVGCAAQTPAARDAHLAGEWTFRLPETHSPYANLAIGQGGQPSTLGLVDEALAATESPKRAVAPAQSKKVPAVQLAKNSPAADPQPTAAALPEPAPSVQPAAPEQLALAAPPVTSAGEEQRYAQRESQSQKQRDFRGGDAIVISASAIVLVLLIVLLVLLLT